MIIGVSPAGNFGVIRRSAPDLVSVADGFVI